MLENWQIKEIIKTAFYEDLPFSDLTTELLIPSEIKGEAYFLAKEDLVVCGTPIAEEVFKFLDPEIKIKWSVKEGEEVKAFTKLGLVKGKIKSILKAERIALNLLQHLSGIATYTRKIVKILSGYKTTLLDTRKTLPGLKALQKYAVRIGGAQNHRFSLSDGILIKDNHIKALGGIKKVIDRLKSGKFPHYLKIEIEVSSLEEIKLLLQEKAPVDILLLDNFSLEEVKEALALIKSYKTDIKTEISGGITLENIEEYAKLGVDFISSGALTHSVKAVDISLKVK
jgi:nicotinate-nucleotide pyrophosphorylase (carboxylating)